MNKITIILMIVLLNSTVVSATNYNSKAYAKAVYNAQVEYDECMEDVYKIKNTNKRNREARECDVEFDEAVRDAADDYLR